MRVIGRGTDVRTDCREPHHMLGIRLSLSGRAAMHLHPGLAFRTGSRAHKGTAYSETREPCCTRQTNLLVLTTDKRKGDLGEFLCDDEKSTDMALFHRNAAVIDSSGEQALLSPLLLCQNMSQSRLVTFTKGGGAHHAKE